MMLPGVRADAQARRESGNLQCTKKKFECMFVECEPVFFPLYSSTCVVLSGFLNLECVETR
jgi:hypothetical protein